MIVLVYVSAARRLLEDAALAALLAQCRRNNARRQFESWSMALRRLADLPPEDRDICTSLLAANSPGYAPRG
ncbi:MAG TPA: hypothetical protein VNF99_16195 [Stellaceae bacterium]|nr:hypothetical protein [Stellaceae bacterium]